MGHLKQDFDTSAYLSGIYLYVTNVPSHYFALYPITLFAIQVQAIRDRKQRLVIRADSYPQHASDSHVYAFSWLLRSSARINLISPENNLLENDIIGRSSLYRRVANK